MADPHDRLNLSNVADVLDDVCRLAWRAQHLTTHHRDEIRLVPVEILIETRLRVRELLDKLDETIGADARPVRHRRTPGYWLSRVLFRDRFGLPWA
jgi:hypothetical protein